ncbi:Leucine rich repeat-containing protein [Acetitomaculum ruminis DSM 5522]|uniref:Leucine rich repeat-containing protein n=1 Tax=Acetitomaculum ruminis DSM 5522 TaxID=1120918 RepID=A0A1I0ZJE0_9FIRM|nr:leucine-rich repeat protein [Acetitomaculum ruminis]SFB24518.1 Leucine rich repeat-containing protein [Acetitomaculum ruminis DSM 5522]
MGINNIVEKTGKLIAVFLGIIVISFFGNDLKVNAAGEEYAYFTIEKFVLGQGYVLEPTKIKIGQNEYVSDVLSRLADEKGLTLESRSSSYGYYLSGIKDCDSKIYNIPSILLLNCSADLEEYTYEGEFTNVDDSTDLEEFKFTPFSGWVYFVNDEWQFVGMGNRVLHSNEVVRLKFTIALGDSGWGMDASKQMTFPDESDLIRILADLKIYLKENPDDDLEEIYQKSLLIMSDLDATVKNVDKLTEYMKDFNEALTDNDKDRILEIKEDIEELEKVVKANDVSRIINLIPETLTLDTMYTVKKALEAYDALDEDSRYYITENTYNALLEGKKQLESLNEQIEREKKLKEAAQKVIDKINSIGSVTLNKKNKINEARKAYDALEKDAKKLIDSTILKKLSNAESKLAKLIKESEQISLKKGSGFYVNGYKYIVTGVLKKNPTVTVTAYKNKNLKTIKVADTVKYKKITFKVTAIAKNAFKNQKKALSAVIGKNVISIGKEAFMGDAKLKKITIKSLNLKKVDSKALKSIYKNAIIKVPVKKYTAYKKLFKGKGQLKTVKFVK